ncbi:MAG: hypothetical protein ACK5IQ_03235 [Bacteroidales bacterium]
MSIILGRKTFAPTEFKIDSFSNYTHDDIDYVIYGFADPNANSVRKKNINDTVMWYFNEEGFTRFFACRDYPIIASPGESCRMSNTRSDYSDVSVFPYPKMKEVIDAIPIGMLNGTSCGIEIDRENSPSLISCMGEDITTYFIKIRFKDGNEKEWSFYTCVSGCDCGYSKIDGFANLVEKLNVFHFLPSDSALYLAE